MHDKQPPAMVYNVECSNDTKQLKLDDILYKIANYFENHFDYSSKLSQESI